MICSVREGSVNIMPSFKNFMLRITLSLNIFVVTIMIIIMILKKILILTPRLLNLNF